MRSSQTGKDELSRLSQNRTLPVKINRAVGSFHNQVAYFGFLGRNVYEMMLPSSLVILAPLMRHIIARSKTRLKKLYSAVKTSGLGELIPQRENLPLKGRFNIALKGRIFLAGLYENLITKIH